jgi:REP element-mobilizing transposase RayT
MKYNPNIHNRRSIRLRGYDYSREGLYFITICTQNRECLFGEITNGKMILNEYGKIVETEWNDLKNRYPHIELYEYCVMPNHFHAIVGAGFTPVQNNNVAQNNNTPAQNNNTPAQNNRATVGAGFTPAQNNDVAQNNRATARVAPTTAPNNDVAQNDTTVAPTVGQMVGAFKSLVVKKCLEIAKSRDEYLGKIWQRNYWEHIIRDGQSYQTITEYIINNPEKWGNDKLYQQEK